MTATTSVPEARTAFEDADKMVAEAEELRNAAEANLLRAQMLGMAAEHPDITGFEYSAYWEYDDESSYFWSIAPRVLASRPLGKYTHRSPSGREFTYDLEEKLADELHGAGIEAWAALTGNDPRRDCEEGSVTVEQLRAP